MNKGAKWTLIILFLLFMGFLMVDSIEIGDLEDQCDEDQILKVVDKAWTCVNDSEGSDTNTYNSTDDFFDGLLPNKLCLYNESSGNIACNYTDIEGGSSGNSSFNFSLMNNTFLKLDASNDPITNDLTLDRDLWIGKEQAGGNTIFSFGDGALQIVGDSLAYIMYFKNGGLYNFDDSIYSASELRAETSVKSYADSFCNNTNCYSLNDLMGEADGNCSFGDNNEIPVTNAGTDDFDYSADFTYDGSTLDLGPGTVQAEHIYTTDDLQVNDMIIVGNLNQIYSGQNSGSFYFDLGKIYIRDGDSSSGGNDGGGISITSDNAKVWFGSFERSSIYNDGSNLIINPNEGGGGDTLKISSSGAGVDIIRDEDDMASDDANALSTQQSIKAYVDANAGGSQWDDNYTNMINYNCSGDVAVGIYPNGTFICEKDDTGANGSTPTFEGFAVYQSSDQTISGATFTLLQYDTENYDTGDNFNSANYTWVAPRDGIVMFAIQSFGEGNEARKVSQTRLYKNGAPGGGGSHVKSAFLMHPYFGSYWSQSLVFPYNVTEGESYAVYAYNSFAGNSVRGGAEWQNIFSGHYID